MSAGNFKQLVANKMLENLNRKSEKIFKDASRLLMESAQVQQCLVINKRAIDQLQVGFQAGVSPTEVDKKILTKYRRELRKELRRFAKPPPKQLTEGLYADILKKRNLKFGRTILFMSMNFKRIRKVVEEFHVKFAKEELAVNFDQQKFTGTTDFDHGRDGPAQGTFSAATFGVATAIGSGIDQQKLMATVGNNVDNLIAQESNLQSKIELKRRLFDLMANFDQVVNPDGTVAAGAALIVTPLDRKENRARSPIEKKEQNIILQALEAAVREHLTPEDYLNFVGSSTLKDKMSKVVLENYVDNITENKNLKKKVNITANIKGAKLKTSTKTDGNKTAQVKAKPKKAKLPRGKKAVLLPGGRGGRKDRAQLSKVSLQSFLAILNTQIQRQVAKNMGAPRLENRTGRFLSSIRAVDIQTTARGFPSVGYTYEKNPYQVFEATSGTRASSTERDPRRLIELSIREIAAQNQIGRLFARRI